MKGLLLPPLLALQVAAYLCLAHQQQVLMAPDPDGWHDMVEQKLMVPRRQWFVPQEEILHSVDVIEQEEFLPDVSIEQKAVSDEFPESFILEEPAFSPRGWKPQPGSSVVRPRRTGSSIPDFPPGQPSNTNIKSICSPARVQPNYGPHNLPQSGFGYQTRQGNAIKSIEEGYDHCCTQEGQVACAQEVWVDALTDFCDRELRIKKAVYYVCCFEFEDEARFRCFASEAPYPNYDKEISSIDLGTINDSAMAVLCGTSKLISKQIQIPLLVKNLTDKCCSGTPEERLKCAEEQKDLFIADVCSAKKDSWKDSEKCCSKESKERADCFNRSYLQRVSIASASTTE